MEQDVVCLKNESFSLSQLHEGLWTILLKRLFFGCLTFSNVFIKTSSTRKENTCKYHKIYKKIQNSVVPIMQTRNYKKVMSNFHVFSLPSYILCYFCQNNLKQFRENVCCLEFFSLPFLNRIIYVTGKICIKIDILILFVL